MAGMTTFEFMCILRLALAKDGDLSTVQIRHGPEFFV